MDNLILEYIPNLNLSNYSLKKFESDLGLRVFPIMKLMQAPMLNTLSEGMKNWKTLFMSQLQRVSVQV